MEYLVFSSDGVLRVNINEKKVSLPLSFLKEQSSMSELRFMSYWLSKKVLFEEGLTIGTFLICLEPFKKYLNEYLDKDIASYIVESKKLISIDQRLNFDWVTLTHNSTISEQGEYAKTTDSKSSDIIGLFNQVNKERMLKNKWKMYNSYMVSAYKHGESESYSICNYAMQKIQHIPLFLDNDSRIIINQKDIKNTEQGKSLLNPEAFGVITQVLDGDYNIEYLLIDKEHTWKDVIEGFFKFFNKDIPSRELENEMFEDLSNEEQENKDEIEDEEVVKLVIHGGYFNQVMQEVEQQNQLWDNLVKTASAQQEIIKIGKIKEGVLPEKKLFGQSITEEIKNLKL